MTVVKWKITPEELLHLNDTKELYLTFIGGLPPHYPSVTLQAATHPA